MMYARTLARKASKGKKFVIQQADERERAISAFASFVELNLWFRYEASWFLTLGRRESNICSPISFHLIVRKDFLLIAFLIDRKRFVRPDQNGEPQRCNFPR